MSTAEPQLLTPRDLALAIGTSESSVRRWLDAGNVKVTRTAGGHRRIALSEALRFVRESGATVVRPEILQVRGVRKRLATPRKAEGADELFEALVAGRADVARGLVASWYLGGRSLADIIDRPVRMAMERVGQLWGHNSAGILQEHQATAACLESLVHLRDLLITPAASAPVALGGAPEGDYYLIPTLAAASVLREARFRDRNYGANTPLRLLAEAAQEQKANLVWVSISTEPGSQLVDQLSGLAHSLEQIDAHLVVGGQFAGDHVPVGPNVRQMNSMAELAAFAADLR